MDVYSVFCIGTGHTKDEDNNTMKFLYDDCRGGLKYINDGPTGLSAGTGWGMNTMLRDTMADIKSARPRPDRVNLAGHSRGAVLCHMLAHAIGTDLPGTEITLSLIDPVHMSKIPHAGAEDLDANPKLLAYQAIIMENENTKLKGGPGGKLYPFQFLTLADQNDAKKIHYINMPGTHGSGTQVLTNPIGKVVKELVANFMRKRGTQFKTLKKSDIEMCELFAQVHLQNPFSKTRSARLIFNDKGKATTHDVGNKKWQGLDGRAASVATALQHSRVHVPEHMTHRDRIDNLGQTDYFINEKHAKFFSLAFPNLWAVIANKWKISRRSYLNEMHLMYSHPGLKGTFWRVRNLLDEKMPNGAFL
ncbi:MAG TPA: hypothetical protein VE178_00780 [Silvibacterium sp.]|jgi:hypothetical protein|nr:hypothetical protein [Silvibacterium sp.]